jgi:hypothetical protein
MPRHILLSYSVKDLHSVRRLRDALNAHGLACWPNRVLTPGSDRWRANIKTAVAQAACVVVVLSPETLLSRWVTLALDYAVEFHIPVIPVVVRGEPGHVLMVKLDGLDWFDLRRTSRYKSEVEGLVTLVRSLTPELVVEMA